MGGRGPGEGRGDSNELDGGRGVGGAEAL